MQTMKTSLAALAAIVFALPVHAQNDAKLVTPDISQSLRQEIERAISRGLASLAKNQLEDGSWGQADFPALTGLPVTAFFLDPSRKPGDPVPPHVEKALEFIVSKVKTDGGIYGRGLGSYNTSLCMMALHATGRKEYKDIILNARRFLVNQQSDFDKRGKIDNPFDGGIGYGATYSHSDLSNTHLALEALYYTKNLLAEEPGVKKEEQIDLDWKAAIEFVERCQNRPETNEEDWASGDPENGGGFIYFPGKSMAGEQKLKNGKVALRSYGSMSYAGLLSFIYADLKTDDPRVEAVMKWLKRNYSIKENPGMGEQGLYYYYHTMAKALSITGIEQLELADGKKIDWRHELAKKLFNLQREDGSWVNENGRWWEKDPVLVSSYAILALQRIHGSL